jgi:hypothetical protein
MDFAKILAQLREELKNVDAAIQTLEQLEQGSRRRSRSATENEPPNQDAPSSSAKNTHAARVSGARKKRRNDPGTP